MPCQLALPPTDDPARVKDVDEFEERVGPGARRDSSFYKVVCPAGQTRRRRPDLQLSNYNCTAVLSSLKGKITGFFK